ncbi:MAG: transposase, partial [Butyrivibrio sp.]|nr:transposase [Butyrivibrio sp.]
TSNHIERLNRELKRRANVIGVFPNSESVVRLMGSVLMEMHEVSINKKSIGYPKELLNALDECEVQLRAIALEQEKLLAA